MALRDGEAPGGTPLWFRIDPGGDELVRTPAFVVVGAYTGRDREAVAEHILELAELGVPAPATVPSFYGVSPQLLIQGDRLVTTEASTSGEVEAALVVEDGEVYVAVSSDHTDRAAERYDVAVSKRACPKVVGRDAWRLVDVVDHWDEVELRSWIGEDGDVPYQEGVLGALLPPLELLASIPWQTEPPSFALLCGTLPALPGIQPSSRFRAELYDPVCDRRLSLDYTIEALDHLRTATDDLPVATTPSP